jgi:aminopeptidase N
MRLFTHTILVIFTILPTFLWANTISYFLDVKVDTQTQRLSGIARFQTHEPQALTLSLDNLSHLTVNGKAVSVVNKPLTVEVQPAQELIIHYQAALNDAQMHFVDQDNVFLTGHWYPQPNELVQYRLSVTLPRGFLAISEAEKIQVQETLETSTFTFQFNQPLDAINLAASKNYALKTSYYKNIALEAYFFNEDVHLAETYLEYTKKYLAMYEQMLTPYPYQRFAIVENILPTGYSMPTYTLLGRAVVHLPFIVKTSLGHEILHQWFGNSVFIDYEQGNWAEGITNYLADQHYAALSGNGVAYRKQIMVDYQAYVNENNVMPVKAFKARHNKAQRTIGYGKIAMIFHQLRKQYGDEKFFRALRDLITTHSFRAASWRDIQTFFEKATGKPLAEYFTQWREREDIPHITAEEVDLFVTQGKLTLSLTLVQQEPAYHLQIPMTVYTPTGQTQHWISVSDAKEKISLTLDEPPTKVVLDENYDLMRKLWPAELPPTLGRLVGKEKVIVVMSPEQQALYQPLIQALGLANFTVVTPQAIPFTQLKEHSLLITGFDSEIVDMLFGQQAVPDDGVRVVVHNNPYNDKEVIALLQAKNSDEVKSVARRLSHYGKYSTLAFNQGRNTEKAITSSENGMTVFTRAPTRALQPTEVATLDDIMPKIASSRVIYVGEQHDRLAHHLNQLMIIKKLHEAGHKIAVGMEMFQVPYQSALNDYLAGKIDEPTFLQRSQYFNNWRLDYNLYKPIIDYVKAESIPLIALNIDQPITKKVARQGIHNLTDEEKLALPMEIDVSNDRYQQDLYQVFKQHQEIFGDQNFEYFLQSQVLWDETMAQTAAQFMAQHPDTQLIILAGNGHIKYRYGIPNRLHRRNGETFTVIVQDDQITPEIGDYVLLTEELEGKTAPKLGVWIDEQDNQLSIKRVSENSPAQKGGLQAKDIILQLSGREIRSLADLKWVLFYTDKGSTVTITVMRDGEKITQELTLVEERRHHKK